MCRINAVVSSWESDVTDSSRTLIDAGEWGQLIKDLAEQEERSISQTGRMLLKEAILARQQKRNLTIGQISQLLEEFSSEELITTAERIFQVMRNRITDTQTQNPETTNTTPEISDGFVALECWQSIAKGKVPSPPELIKLGAALEIDPVVLQKKLTKLKDLMTNGT
jgi:hypothetical protein